MEDDAVILEGWLQKQMEEQEKTNVSQCRMDAMLIDWCEVLEEDVAILGGRLIAIVAGEIFVYALKGLQSHTVCTFPRHPRPHALPRL